MANYHKRNSIRAVQWAPENAQSFEDIKKLIAENPGIGWKADNIVRNDASDNIMICAVGFVIEIVGMSPITMFLEATGVLEAREAFLQGFEIILSCVCKVSFTTAVLLAFAAYKARWEL